MTFTKIKLCEWVLPNGHLCDKTSVKGSSFCYTHKPLGDVDYHRDMQEILDDQPGYDERLWMDENSDYAAWESKHLREFDEFYDKHSWEDDLEYSFEKWKANGYKYPLYENRSTVVTYPEIIVPKKLEKEAYFLEHSIDYMRYVIARLNTGEYVAVWVSLIGGSDFEKAMKLIMKNLPSGVTSHGKGNYHSSKPFKEYNDALALFNCGYEHEQRTRRRIADAKRNDWYPPNLRKLAFEGRLNEVPERSRKALKQWLLDGAPGWHGHRHNKK